MRFRGPNFPKQGVIVRLEHLWEEQKEYVSAENREKTRDDSIRRTEFELIQYVIGMHSEPYIVLNLLEHDKNEKRSCARATPFGFVYRIAV